MIQRTWMRQCSPDRANVGPVSTRRMLQLKKLLREGIRSKDIVLDAAGLQMLSKCVMNVLWVPDNQLRDKGTRPALINSRETVVRGIADPATTSSQHTPGGARVTTDANPQPLARLEMLASALAGRTLAVAAAQTGEPAWTDGRTIFIDAALSARHRLEALTVQACLIAAGSLESDIARKLTGRSAVTRRYLAIEGQRALAANDDLLPAAVSSLLDADLGSRTDSPTQSLGAALSRAPIADPPPSFGALRPRKLLAQHRSAHNTATVGEHIPRRQAKQTLTQLDSDTDDGQEVADLFSSPVGGGGALGKLLQKMLGLVRQLSGGGQPGADAPTHRTRAGVRGEGAVVSRATAPTDEDADGEKRGTKYPSGTFIGAATARLVHGAGGPAAGQGGRHLAVCRGMSGCGAPLARLGIGLQRWHRQAQGDDIDIDAAIEARVEALAGSAPDERGLPRHLAAPPRPGCADPAGRLWLGSRTRNRGQNRAPATARRRGRVDSAALPRPRRSGGVVRLPPGRSAVHVMPVKRFNDALDAAVMARLYGLVPSAYSRLGAAIRHGAAVLEKCAGTPRRLLVVISDGLAYDHGYEHALGAADARRALTEARRRGTGCLCLTIGASTDANALRQVFGSAAHAQIPRPDQLGGGSRPTLPLRAAIGRGSSPPGQRNTYPANP